jgi:MoaA/NifB/PqqE/SkfB family radical SAM enzyme
VFDRITVSIDGATDATFKSIRGYAHLSKIMEALERIKATRRDVVIYLKMTIQRQNFREILDVFELGLHSKFVDGVGFGIPDLSAFAFGFDHTAPAIDAYIEATFPTVDELDELTDLIRQLLDRHADAISTGFLYEGDLTRYLARLRAIRGLSTPPPSRDCCIPHHSMVLKADGSISGCYFLPNVSTLDDLKEFGEKFHVRAIAGHSPVGHPVCSRCDQLLFRNSAFEHAMEDRHDG